MWLNRSKNRETGSVKVKPIHKGRNSMHEDVDEAYITGVIIIYIRVLPGPIKLVE